MYANVVNVENNVVFQWLFKTVQINTALLGLL